MLTRMTDEDWATVLEVFRACRTRRGAKSRDDRIFLEALHYFAVHNITWRALPEAFGNWNSVWMVDSQTTNSALSVTVS
jgi:transposase